MQFDKFQNPDKPSEKKKAIRHEKRIAKEIKGKSTICSGSLINDKADVKRKNVRIECKRTDKDQIILKREWLDKLKNECGIKDIPVFNLEIGNDSWYMVRKEEFAFILQEIENYS